MRDRAARPALADDRGDQRHAEREAFLGRAGDRLGLAALLGLDPGKGAGRVDQGHHRQAEPVGQLHQPDRLAIALGLGHAEIVLEPGGGVVAFLMADQHHPAAADPRQAADDRRVVGEIAVAGQRHEILDQPGDIILEMRPLGMARDLRLLPRRQLGIGVAQQLARLGLEPVDLGVDVESAAARGLAQLGDAGLELGDRLFEIEIGQHCGARVGRLRLRVNDRAVASGWRR